ncbi:hypothetical protein [Pedobacter sp. MW01-1-1]|uniref:hypothetical protein n=1 Tax=Pedobacter sp. MW01-1-1 TaxID=3383027 RepID=UPI003FF09E66
MKTKLSLLLILLTFSLTQVFAHALWIETASQGKKGQTQEVKVFFGEYESKEPDTAAKWFSNLKEFKLLLIAPDGTSKVINSTADVLFHKASFTPDQDGTYKLAVVHEVAAVYEHAKIEYYAFADVSVGKANTNTHFPKDALLTIQADKSGNQMLYKKAPLAKQKLTVINPDYTKQEPETDANGKFTFQTTQKGKYFVEAFTEEKVAGKLNNKDFEKIWHLVTYTTQVK